MVSEGHIQLRECCAFSLDEESPGMA